MFISHLLGNITCSIIKPDAVKKGYIIPILLHIYRYRFHLIALKMKKFTEKEYKTFYKEHQNKPFFMSLVRFMSSGPVVSMILKKKNAVKDFRTIIGHTDPKISKKGTIRNLYASSIESNAIHGSDNDENAIKECEFIFNHEEIFIDMKNHNL
ncbi:nucleoside-diphosphate kinase [Blattabacterium cuenoti]|uniref:nucleoside-diphosphate kinase n=1 Tax=Blattabacterium cuenoti TaxID=1653831 RepID=UPI00163C6679|nr:nucleoside-diphosphate kinase [Blattabacterium cuenoti]